MKIVYMIVFLLPVTFLTRKSFAEDSPFVSPTSNSERRVFILKPNLMQVQPRKSLSIQSREIFELVGNGMQKTKFRRASFKKIASNECIKMVAEGVSDKNPFNKIRLEILSTAVFEDFNSVVPTIMVEVKDKVDSGATEFSQDILQCSVIN